MENIVELLATCVERGKISKQAPYPPDMKDQDGVEEITANALAEGAKPDIVLEACMLGMDRIGEKFGQNKVFVPELLMAAKAMTAAMNHLKPFLESGDIKHRGQFVIGTVSGDLHDIGKNLVSMTIKGYGFEVIDLGVDVSTEKFLQTIADYPNAFVGLSALLTTTMGNMEKSVKAIKEKYPDTTVLIGGAPVTQDFCSKIGADFYANDPQGAAEFLKNAVAA